MEKVKEFFRSVLSWILEHKKVVAIGVLVFVLLIVITACSTIGEAGNVQFGLVNSSSESSSYVPDSV